jgi:predicted transcriptional regulator of viral defense system
VPRLTTLGPIAEIAQDQWGLITRRQAERAGTAPATLDRLTADGGVLERIAHGVYHLVGAPLPDHLDLRAAWLQLAPGTLAWERVSSQGVVSHRSAAVLYGPSACRPARVHPPIEASVQAAGRPAPPP